MNRKIAAVLLAAAMLTTPAFAAGVASSTNTPTAQTENNNKATKTSDKGVKKHRVHARASHTRPIMLSMRSRIRRNTPIRLQKRT